MIKIKSIKFFVPVSYRFRHMGLGTAELYIYIYIYTHPDHFEIKKVVELILICTRVNPAISILCSSKMSMLNNSNFYHIGSWDQFHISDLMRLYQNF